MYTWRTDGRRCISRNGIDAAHRFLHTKHATKAYQAFASFGYVLLQRNSIL